MAQTIADLQVKISVVVKEATKGIKEVKNKVSGLQDKFTNFKKTSKIVWAGLGTAVVGGIIKSVKAASKFESSLARLSNASGITGKELSNLGTDAQKLGARFGVSSNDVVHGLEEMSKLGFKTQDSLKAMPQLLKFNAIAGTDFSTSVGIMEVALNDFGMSLKDTSKISDIFVNAINRGQMSANDLKSVLKLAGNSGKKAGASIQDVSAAASILARKGFAGGEAGTALNAIFGRLTKTTGPAAKTLRELGISVTDSRGKLLPFGKQIESIKEKFSKLTDAQKLQAASSIAGTEHQSKFLALIEGSPGSFQKLSDSLVNTGGTTDKFFNTIDKTAEQGMARLKSSFKSFEQTLGKVFGPPLSAALSAITYLMNGFTKLSPKTQKVIGIIAALAGAFVLLGGIITIIAPVITILGSLFSFLGSILGVVAGVLGITLGAFIAIGVAIFAAAALIYIFWDEIVAGAKAAWKAVKKAFSSMGKWIAEVWEDTKKVVKDTWGAIVKGVTDVKDDIIKAWDDMVKSIKEAATGVWDSIVQSVLDFKDTVIEIWNNIVNGIVDSFKWLYDHNYYFEALVDFIVETFNTVKNWITEKWNEIKNYLKSVWESIVTSAEKEWKLIKDSISSFLLELWNEIKDIWNKIKTTTLETWKNVKSTISNAITAVWNTVKTTVTNIWNQIKQKWEQIKTATSQAFNTVKTTVTNIWNKIATTLSGLAKQAYRWGSNMINDFIKGIKSKIGAIGKAIGQVGKTMWKLLGFHSPPDKGILSDSDKWMPNMMNMLYKGIEMGIPKLQMAVGDVASTLDLTSYNPGRVTTNNVNIYPRAANLDAKGLNRELTRMSWLNGGLI